MNSMKEMLDSLLFKYLPTSHSKLDKSIFEAMNYSFTIGGKRIRPMLLYAGYDLISSDMDAEFIAPFMAALEMIHTYSLIHDDLPAMDNDDLRRGKPTCHVKYDEATAILAGDGLLNYAYELCMAKSYEYLLKDVEQGKRCLLASKTLAYAAGVYGMIGGQGADIKFESEPLISKDELNFIHEHKTGALIEAALLMGGILGGATKSQLEALSVIGKNIGLSFQIQDDILDLTSTTTVLGKPIGSDEKNNKKTYVSFVGMEQSRKDIHALLNQATEITNEFGSTSSVLIEIIDFLKTREY